MTTLTHERAELRAQALACLEQSDPAAKVAAVAAMAAAFQAGRSAIAPHDQLESRAPIPGRPLKPELVAPRLVGRRSMVTLEGRAMLVHALAHIEFNAMKTRLEYWIH